MKLDSNTLALLENFASINPSIRFVGGERRLRTIAPTKSVMANADIGQEIPKTFIIGDLSRFLAVLSLFADPEINLEDDYLTVESEGRSVKYAYADESVVALPPKEDIKISSVYETFVLPAAIQKEILKALRVMSLSDLAIVGDGESIYLQGSGKVDMYRCKVGKTDKTFTASMLVDNVKNVPADYKVTVCDAGIVQFEAETEDGSLNYWVALENNKSTFE